MKTASAFLSILLLVGQAQASVNSCSLDTLEPRIEDGIKSNLKQIDPQLDISTVVISKGPEMTELGIKFFDYSVSVKDKSGHKFQVVTFTEARKSGKLLKKVAHLPVSDVVTSGSQGISASGSPLSNGPTSCDSQYLSFTSLWSQNNFIYATRLVNEKGQIVKMNEDSDIFDRALRAASEEIIPVCAADERFDDSFTHACVKPNPACGPKGYSAPGNNSCITFGN